MVRLEERCSHSGELLEERGGCSGTLKGEGGTGGDESGGTGSLAHEVGFRARSRRRSRRRDRAVRSQEKCQFAMKR